MSGAGIDVPLVGAGEAAAPAAAAHATARLRAMIANHGDFAWRALRRLGLPAHACDDATQRVFLVASRRLDEIAPAAERAFLFQTAVRMASAERRASARRREVLSDEDLEIRDLGPTPEDLLDQRRARALLDAILDRMAMELRLVFVLFELEGMTTSEIATVLELPIGTVGSRLRRAREDFQAALKRHQARTGARGGTP